MYTADVDLAATPRRIHIHDENRTVVRTTTLGADEQIHDALAREQLYPLGVECDDDHHVRIVVLPRLERSADGPLSIAIDRFSQQILASIGGTMATFDIDQGNSAGVNAHRHRQTRGMDLLRQRRFLDAWANFQGSPTLVVKAITPDELLPGPSTSGRSTGSATSAVPIMHFTYTDGADTANGARPSKVPSPSSRPPNRAELVTARATGGRPRRDQKKQLHMRLVISEAQDDA
ncbi:hypothetical protein [Phytoactinopolyspora endophytica]|uniref:hypothetical protein n=1 Tax=Phytoactinopolyspora endophytica TaxID=1642495 RepID=UPI00101B922E|nr:hypothetical protein [Phytoactinopolyspora endophytica]